MQPKILIVEDDVDIVEMLKYPLEQANFEVEAVYDGQAAINAITEQKPDLILLDLMLPNISGVEVYRTISRNPQVKNIPVIMVTAKSEEIDRLQNLIKKDPNDHTHAWFAGGLVAGILLSIGIYYAAAEANK